MVDYYQKWGGGSDQKFVKDVSRFCKAMGLSPSIRVSGRTFRSLAALNFGTDMPAYAVMAVLKCAAASPKVVDGIASSITTPDIVKLGSKLKEEFLKVDGIIRNSELKLQANDIPEPMRSLKAGWLQMTLIEHLLGRPSGDGKKFDDTGDIVKYFIRDVFGEATEAPVATPAPAHDSSATIVQYDNAGSAIDVGKMILVDEGFEVGLNYYAKGHRALDPSEPVAWKLISIAGNGSSKLQAYSGIGVLVERYTTVAGEELAKNFGPFKKEFELCCGYPSNEAQHHVQMKNDILTCRVNECLVTLAATMIDHALDVRISPSRAVFAKADLKSEIAVGTLRLTPVAGSVKMFDENKKGAVRNPRTQCTTHRPDGSVYITVMSSPQVEEKLCNAYWSVACTDVKDLANMELVTEDVSFILASP